MSFFIFHLRSSSVSSYEISLCRPEVRSFDPLIPSQSQMKGGGHGNLFQSSLMWPFSLQNFPDFFIPLFRIPVLRAGFPLLLFSMDNLRGYGEDEQASSSSSGRSVAKLPSSSEGPLAPPTTQASVMADSSPAVTLVTSGPVPAVSAPSQPASSVPKDSALSLDDLPPPPPPAEPYEVFMARVQRDLSSLPVRPTQSGAAVPPCAAVAMPTTGSLLPTPFPRFEDSSWALQPQAPNIRIRMPLPHPVTWRLHRPGCGPDGAPPLPRPWSVVPCLLRCRPPLLDLVDLQDFSHDLPQWDLPLFLRLQRLLLIPKWPLLPPALSKIFSVCHAPFYPYCAIVQREHCRSYADAARCWDHFPGTNPVDDQRVEGGIHGGHESFLATIRRWRSTSANSGSLCYSWEHGPRLAAAAESLWRPRGVTGSAWDRFKTSWQ